MVFLGGAGPQQHQQIKNPEAAVLLLATGGGATAMALGEELTFDLCLTNSGN